MKKIKNYGCLLIFLIQLLPGSGNAQINPPVPNTTKDHSRQVIGYITQWDVWKGASNGIPAHAYTHLNIDYSQYTILNFSFFGVAMDGSLHSADFRNKQIYQPGVDQLPAAMVDSDLYSSFDLYFLKGDVQEFWSVDSYLKGLGYKDNGNNTWTDTLTGQSGKFPVIETKQNPAFQSIFKLAHDRGVKVLASIGGWSMCKEYAPVAADSAKRKNFVRDCKRLMAMGFDGIDIDWEYPGRTGMNFTGTPADFPNYLTLMKEIRAGIGSGKLLTGCFSPVVKPNEFDWAQLDLVMDYFNMMTYDYNGGWSNIAGHNAPLYDYPGEEYAGLSLKATLDNLKARGVNLRKVNLGGAFYGRGVICNSASADLNTPTVKTSVTVQPDGPISTAADYDNFQMNVWDGTPNYSYIVTNTANWTEKWDSNAQVPYRVNGKYFLSYDNVKSIGLKAQYIKDNNLAGIIIWQVFGDLMNLNSGPVTQGKLVYCPNATSPLVNEINIVFADKATAIAEAERKEIFSVYPNPSSGPITISVHDPAGTAEITVLNILGEEVYRTVTGSALISLDSGKLEKGAYLVRMRNGQGAASKKIIIQ